MPGGESIGESAGEVGGAASGGGEGRSTGATPLVVDGLTVIRGARRVLDECTFSLESGQVHAIVGHNGAGKTTLFEALFGFHPAAGGTVRLGPRALQQADVAYLPAELELYPGLTGGEVLRLFARGQVADEACRQAIALDVPLGDIVDSYSYGTRRKLALIAVLSLRRPVVVLDEPFEALDVVSREVVRRLLRIVAARGTLVLFSVHELAFLDRFCNTVLLLQEGRVVRRFPEHPLVELEALLAREVDRRVESLEGAPLGP